MTKWAGQDLHNLLTLELDELCRLYPNHTKTGLQRTRRKYRLKARKATDMEQSPNHEERQDLHKIFQDAGIDLTDDDIQNAVQVGFHVGYIRNAEGEIEYTKPLPNIRYGRQKIAASEFISQADPIRLIPNKQKPIKRSHRLIYAFSDSQIDYRLIDGEYVPTHDERALAVSRLICKDLRPDLIINLGDTIDLAALSRFAPDSNHFNHSMKPAINRVHRMYAELRQDNPSATIVEVDSNHNDRLKKFVLKNFPQGFDLEQAGQTSTYPVLSYPFLVNLEAVNVEWVGGYGAAEYVYGEEYDKPPIVFKHGQIVNSTGQTMAKEARANPETHIVRGHGHTIETFYRTNRRGQYLGYIMLGATCDITGSVPSYHNAVNERGHVVKYQENWQQSALVIEDYDGDYNFIHIPIKDGKAFYQGKEYKA